MAFLDGVLVDAGHWRWIFFLTVPIGLLGALWAAHVLPGGDTDRKRVARGSSLVNGTRFVVQSIGVALLTTLLAGSLSPATRALQRRTQSQAVGKASNGSNSGASTKGASMNGTTTSGVSVAAPTGGLCVAATGWPSFCTSLLRSAPAFARRALPI